MNLTSLSDHGLIYLATPYTKYEAGHQKAFEDAASLAGRLVNRGVFVFSPIAHGHPMSQYGGVGICNSLWFPFNRLFETACGALLIAQFEGWRQSDGIFEEKMRFKAANKPVLFIDPEDLRVGEFPLRPASIETGGSNAATV